MTIEFDIDMVNTGKIEAKWFLIEEERLTFENPADNSIEHRVLTPRMLATIKIKKG